MSFTNLSASFNSANSHLKKDYWQAMNLKQEQAHQKILLRSSVGGVSKVLWRYNTWDWPIKWKIKISYFLQGHGKAGTRGTPWTGLQSVANQEGRKSRENPSTHRDNMTSWELAQQSNKANHLQSLTICCRVIRMERTGTKQNLRTCWVYKVIFSSTIPAVTSDE